MRDLLLQVVCFGDRQELGEFDIANVIDHLTEKLIRRHPHVFETRMSTVRMMY